MGDQKLYFKALKQLPDRFIDDETRATTFAPGKVIAANPKYAPIIYREKTGKWSRIKLSDADVQLGRSPTRLE